MNNLKKIKVGTLFSGIGAFEQALEILNIPHEIVFACDNGGILLEDIAKKEELLRIHNEKNLLKKLEFVESIYKKNKKTNFVKQSYLANYSIDEKHFYHDVRYVGSHIDKKIDILVGGSPCQSFSVAGHRGGFEDTRGTLFFEFARCVKEFQPQVFIYENVKGLTHHDKGKTFEIVLNTFNELGYKYFYQILNAKDYGIPQNRQRIFIIGFKDHHINFSFPEKKELQYKMADFLQGEVDCKYFLKENQINFVRNPMRLKKKYTQINGDIALCQKAQQQFNLSGDFVDDKYFLSEKVKKYVMSEGTKNFIRKPTINTDIAKTIVATVHKMHRANMDNYVTVKGELRRLTPRECLRLMGFCDSFQQVVSDTQMYKQAGNSIVVDVLIELIKKILETKVFDIKK
jgi:DNA (cytosine-5)-methyltransferase 1